MLGACGTRPSGSIVVGRPLIVFVGSRIVLKVEGPLLRLPTEAEIASQIDLGTHPNTVRAEVPGAAGNLPTVGLPDQEWEPTGDLRLEGLRVAYHRLAPVDFRAAGTARQHVEWLRTHRFCGACGAETRRDPSHPSLTCTACGQHHFPRVAPAVIVLVQRDAHALLGRSHRFPEGVYSTLAGFVEAGESLEECIHREIEEEVGVTVGNLRYFGSQPHPFPNSLMVGFVADWVSGDIRIDDNELADAQWFHRGALPGLPHRMSIAHALIQDFVDRTK